MSTSTLTNREELRDALIPCGRALDTLNPWKRLRLGTTRELVEFPRAHELNVVRLGPGVVRPTRLKRIGRTALSHTPSGELVVSRRELDGSIRRTVVTVYEISSWEVNYLLKSL